MLEPFWRRVAVCSLLVCAGCRGEPGPSLAPGVSVAAPSSAPILPEPPPATASQVPGAASVSAASSVAVPGPATAGPASASASPPAPSPSEPPLLAEDGTPLPQTEELPSVESPGFQRRMQALAKSILTGDAEHGRRSFFPVVAYAQVKDVQKPERDFKFRLLSNFERDVREYHRALGTDAARAELLGVEVPMDRAQWMKPGSEGNRLGYYRVLRSKLRFRLPGGAERTFELTSMISWRGEWYVVHLHGFK